MDSFIKPVNHHIPVHYSTAAHKTKPEREIPAPVLLLIIVDCPIRFIAIYAKNSLERVIGSMYWPSL